MKPSPAPCWSVVLPVKPLHLAKSRLAVPPALRAEVVLAMAADTVTAALACPRVAQVVVVTDDARAGAELAAAGARVTPDTPDSGLNDALAHGAAVAAAERPDCGVATLSADLPALRPAELAAVLDAAALHPRAVLADASGDGTTLLTAQPGTALVPAYGPHSRERHVAAGHVPLELAGVDSVRRDVDTLADLTAAVRLGTGPRSAAVMRRLPDALRSSGMQGTVASWSAATAAGTVLLDDGTALPFDRAAVDRSVVRLLRFGQRVRLDVGTGPDGMPAVTALTLVTFPAP